MPPESGRTQRLGLILGTGLALGLILWIFSKVDWQLFFTALRNAQPFGMAMAVLLATLSFPIRLPRWRILLPEPEGRRLRAASLWHAIAIGFTANNLPLRVGELIRAATIARLERLPFATGFASLAVERVLDAITVVGLFGIGLTLTDMPGDLLIAGRAVGPLVMRIGMTSLGAVVFLLIATWKPLFTLAILRRVLPSGNITEKIVHFTAQILDGLAALRNPRRAILVMAWSTVLWLVNATGFWIAALAFGIQIPWTASLIIQGMVVAGLVLVPSPGGIGGFEAAIVATLALFQIDESRAMAYALSFHLITAIPIVLLGLYSLRKVGGSWRTPELPSAESTHP